MMTATTATPFPGLDLLAAALHDTTGAGSAVEARVPELAGPPPFTGTHPVSAPVVPDAAAADSAMADPEELRRVGAEVVAMIERHRRELEATMAELTRMQRAIRQEARDLVQQLELLADAPAVDLTDGGGVSSGPSAQPVPPMATVAPVASAPRPDPAAPAPGGRRFGLRLSRAGR